MTFYIYYIMSDVSCTKCILIRILPIKSREKNHNIFFCRIFIFLISNCMKSYNQHTEYSYSYFFNFPKRNLSFWVQHWISFEWNEMQLIFSRQCNQASCDIHKILLKSEEKCSKHFRWASIWAAFTSKNHIRRCRHISSTHIHHHWLLSRHPWQNL